MFHDSLKFQFLKTFQVSGSFVQLLLKLQAPTRLNPCKPQLSVAGLVDARASAFPPTICPILEVGEVGPRRDLPRGSRLLSRHGTPMKLIRLGRKLLGVIRGM